MRRYILVLAFGIIALGAAAQHRQDFMGGTRGREQRNTAAPAQERVRTRDNDFGLNYGGVRDYSSVATVAPASLSWGNTLSGLSMAGYVTLDGAMFLGEDTWIAPIGNNVIMRRASIGLNNDFNERWYASLHTEWSNGQFNLLDAFMGYRNGEFRVRAGNFKEDFSIEMNTASKQTPMMELPMAVEAFAPGRSLGVDLRWRHDWLYASAGLFFRKVGGVTEAERMGDNQGMSFTGKLVFNPLWQAGDYGLHVGGGASYRKPKTDAVAYDGFRYSSPNSSAINRTKYLDTGEYTGLTNNELLWNAEVAGWWRGLRVQGEYIAMNNVLKTGLTGIHEGLSQYSFNGYYAMASYVLFGGEQQYDASNAIFKAPTRGRNWGDLELVARYDYLDLTDHYIFGGTGTNYSLGLSYYVNDNIKFMVNYQMTNNDRHANANDEAPIGVDAAGVPTTDPELVVGTSGTQYHLVGFRMQVSF